MASIARRVEDLQAGLGYITQNLSAQQAAEQETQITPEEYDQMRERLGVGDTPPPGGVFHVAALGEDGKVRIVEVWDSREQAEAWGEKVTAAREEAGFGGRPPSIEYLEVHKVIRDRAVEALCGGVAPTAD